LTFQIVAALADGLYRHGIVIVLLQGRLKRSGLRSCCGQTGLVLHIPSSSESLLLLLFTARYSHHYHHL